VRVRCLVCFTLVTASARVHAPPLMLRAVSIGGVNEPTRMKTADRVGYPTTTVPHES
jgi:hypothetical protein